MAWIIPAGPEFGLHPMSVGDLFLVVGCTCPMANVSSFKFSWKKRLQGIREAWFGFRMLSLSPGPCGAGSGGGWAALCDRIARLADHRTHGRLFSKGALYGA